MLEIVQGLCILLLLSIGVIVIPFLICLVAMRFLDNDEEKKTPRNASDEQAEDQAINEAITTGSPNPSARIHTELRQQSLNEDHPQWDKHSAFDLQVEGLKHFGWVE